MPFANSLVICSLRSVCAIGVTPAGGLASGQCFTIVYFDDHRAIDGRGQCEPRPGAATRTRPAPVIPYVKEQPREAAEETPPCQARCRCSARSIACGRSSTT